MMGSKPDWDAVAADLGPQARRDKPLADHTAMRVGGPADVLVVCPRVDDVLHAVKVARRHQVPWRVLGDGCNVLAADAGVAGLVIVNETTQIEFDGPVVLAEAGAPLAVLARETVARGLAGLEWAAGLPGSVGGAVVGNAGAFDGDIAAVLRQATVLDPESGEVLTCPNAWFEFDYRLSRIKRQSEQGQRSIVLTASFDLEPGDVQQIQERLDEILEWRRTRHPNGATMGSTFKNPPGSHAGYLIEQAGLRGYQIGGARISDMHGNFFMNTGTATAADVLALIQHAQAVVEAQFGFVLEPEIEFIGRWGNGAS